ARPPGHACPRGADGSLRAADHRARDRRAAHLRVLPLAAAPALGHMALGPGPAFPPANKKPAASTTWRASCVACFWWSGGGSNSRPSHCECKSTARKIRAFADIVGFMAQFWHTPFDQAFADGCFHQ